ncbi:MAG TPA: hypothetical protein VHF89_06115, partial [Solirubrobacteraceae bacterium]|nr:hypothetical protein [Solirubrobacteraceae bacterium]
LRDAVALAERRLRARLRGRALGIATRRAVAGVPAEQERLRAEASEAALRRAVARARRAAS